MRLSDRGVLKAGMWADVVVFDPAQVRDQATFAQPNQLSEGMRWVLVNGVPVIAEGKATGALPGKVLRGPGTAYLESSNQSGTSLTERRQNIGAPGGRTPMSSLTKLREVADRQQSVHEGRSSRYSMTPNSLLYVRSRYL